MYLARRVAMIIRLQPDCDAAWGSCCCRDPARMGPSDRTILGPGALASCLICGAAPHTEYLKCQCRSGQFLLVPDSCELRDCRAGSVKGLRRRDAEAPLTGSGRPGQSRSGSHYPTVELHPVSI